MTTRNARLTNAVQETLVGDGLAVGCHAAGVTAFTANKQISESSFNYAWRDFPLARTQFPTIKASLERCDLTGILYDSPTRRSSDVAWHQDGGWWVPNLRSADDYQEVADLMRKVYGILPSAWLELAEPFVERLGAEKVRRA
jgi:hypothetical protein